MEDNSTELLQLGHLPHDLISQHILPWLPIKSLIRFKLVSKQWYSSISSPSFIKNHFKLSLFSHPFSTLQFLLIQSRDALYLHSCDLDDDLQVTTNSEMKNLIKLQVGFQFQDTYLIGSSNGLICLADSHNNYFILWNPATAEYRIHYPEDFDSKDPIFVNWGFGYVSSQNDHKVVRISVNWIYERLCNTVHVFSLKFNRWEKIKFSLDLHFFPERARLANEILYWAWNCKSTESRKIVAFDLKTEKFKVFPHLGLSSEHDKLCVMGGCLSKCASTSQNALIIDIFKCPTRVVSVRVLCDLRQSNFDDLIGFTKTGKLFVADNSIGKIVRVDMSSEPEQSVAIFKKCSENTRIDAYVPSNVSPYPSAELGQVAYLYCS